jgi:hypothetical protein
MALTRIGLNQSINLASNVTGTLPTWLMVVQEEHLKESFANRDGLRYSQKH